MATNESSVLEIKLAGPQIDFLDRKAKEIGIKAQKIYQELSGKGISVLYDDRDVSNGEKFVESDLIGIPVRLVISEKTKDKIEWKERKSEKKELLSLEEIVKRLKGK